jgi:hypothetical protein
MRKRYVYLALLPLAVVLAVAVWWVRPSPGRPAEPVKHDPEIAQKKLPLTHVVLFNSGVGYFQREGKVEGNQRIDMTFPTSDVNDLLKSMLLEDLSGGKISTVSYDSQEPIEVTLKAFALDLTYNPSFGQLLNQARGEKVEVTTQAANAQAVTLTGQIVGMETQEEGPNKTSQNLNILCTEGLRCVPLSLVQRVRFLNANIDAEFRKALDVMAESRDSQKKSVSISFNGEGQRDVRVGYAIENPIWKTTYRLVIDKDGKLKLQSWAVVENTTDEDWKDVRLTLVAARPISFKMELYQPLYVPRPTVEPARFASLRPPTFNGALGAPGGAQGFNFGQQGFNFGQQGFNFGQQGFNFGQQGFNFGNQGFNFGGNFGYGGNYGGSPVYGGRNAPRLSYEEMMKRREEQQKARVNPIQAGPALAALDPKEIDALMNRDSEEVEDSYEYIVTDKVTIPRQKSAMMPIISKEVQGKRVSVFNERTNSKNPLLGLRFKNTTDLPLMQGPVMVHDGGRYAGDARLMDMQPGEERLIAYAVDLGMEVLAAPDTRWEKVVSVAIRNGSLAWRWERHTMKKYHVKNRSRQDRTLVIEHPANTALKIVSPDKPFETARDFHRFEVKVAAGKAAVLEVEEQLDEAATLQLQSLTESTLNYYLACDATKPKVKEVLQQVQARNEAAAASEQEARAADEQLQALVSDQARLRANIDRVPKDSTVYKRYLEKFDEQETQIEKLQAALKAKRDAVAKKRQELEKYLRDLTVE